MPAIMAVASVAAFDRRAALAFMRDHSAGFVLGTVFLVWALTTSAWTLHADHGQAFRLAGVVVIGITLLASLRSSRAKPMVRAAAIAAALTTSLLLTAFAMSATFVEAVAPSHPELFQRGLSRGFAILATICWPAFAAALKLRRWRIPAFLVLAATVSGALMLSGTDAPLLAFLFVGIPLFAIGAWLKGRAVFLTFSALAIWLCIAPTATPLLWPSSLASHSDIPQSWRHRALIWSHTSDRIAQNPLMGYGLDSSRAFPDRLEFDGHLIKAIPLHPHSASLQIWLETGAIGAMLGAAALLTVGAGLARIFEHDRLGAAAVCSCAAAFALVSNVSFGVWQEWWLCTGFLGVMLLSSLHTDAEDRRAVAGST